VLFNVHDQLLHFQQLVGSGVQLVARHQFANRPFTASTPLNNCSPRWVIPCSRLYSTGSASFAKGLSVLFKRVVRAANSWIA